MAFWVCSGATEANGLGTGTGVGQGWKVRWSFGRFSSCQRDRPDLSAGRPGQKTDEWPERKALPGV